MAKDLAIVLNNGSLNSAVTTALATQKYRPILVHSQTGAANAARRAEAFDRQVTHFKPQRDHRLAVETGLPTGGESADAALLAHAADPRQAAPRGPQFIELLPLLAAAVRISAHHQARTIYLGLRIGPSADELAQGAEYVQIWNELIQQPCALGELEVMTPLLELEPWQVVDVGVQVAAPLELTWSCLEDAPTPCGTCAGCRARAAAFQRAAKPDPLAVR